jgi:hypothetical protein
VAWTVWACNTTTGAKLMRLPAASFTWERVLDSGGSGQTTFKLADPAFAALDMRSLTALVSRTLVIEWDGEPVYAGLVWSRTYDRDTRTLTVNHSDVWSILSKRLLVSQNTTGVEATKLEWLNISVSTVVKKVVQTGTADLPMVYWGDFAGGHDQTYQGYLLKSVADALQDLIDQPDGPDVDFRPIWGPDGLQWQMRSNEQFGTYTWNMSAAQAGVSGVTVTEDGSKLSNNVFIAGQGTEKKSIIRAGPAASPYPLLQSVEAHKDEKVLATLDGFLWEAQRIHSTPTTQWAFDMLASGGNGDSTDQTTVTDLRLNGALSLYSKGDPWIPDGWAAHRLIRYSGDMGHKVKLEFQPTGGA